MSIVNHDGAAPSEHEDNSVLRDVLDELDRERTQRAELEAKVRLLLQNESKHDHTRSREPKRDVSRKDLIALQTEKDGLVELLDAILGDKPAFHAAAKSSSLPLHAVRLLEIMPWDPRARQHALGTEELYEWQFFQKNQWVQNIRQFPPFFRHLPVIEPKRGQEQDVKKKGIFGDLKSPPKHVVLTDAKLTHVVNIDKGYPLPNDDGVIWEWVAGWRVDRHVTVLEQQRAMDCDDKGWTYARVPQDFATRELCWDTATGEDSIVIRPYRRRKWTRPRFLVSYPNASQRTLEYLRLLGENMRLSVSVTKLSDQLVETKTALTETEQRLLESKEESRAELERMRTKLRDADVLFDALELGLKREEAQKDDASPKTTFQHVDYLRKHGEEKIQKIWKSSARNADSTGVERDAEGDLGFDWKRFGHSTGSIIEHIKNSPTLLEHIKNSPGLLARRKVSLDDEIKSTEESHSASKEREAQEQPLLLSPSDLSGRDRGESFSLNEQDSNIDNY